MRGSSGPISAASVRIRVPIAASVVRPRTLALLPRTQRRMLPRVAAGKWLVGTQSRAVRVRGLEALPLVAAWWRMPPRVAWSRY